MILVVIVLQSLILFSIPVLAPGWKSLAVIFVVTIALFGWRIVSAPSVEMSGAAPSGAFTLALLLGFPVLMGCASRALSLLARRRGFRRPRSLVIEAAGAVLTIAIPFVQPLVL